MTSARTRDRLVQRLRDQGIKNLAVLDRIKNVPRHIFVDEALGSRAYEDTALPIGFGQTISQPYIVARMTEALLEGGPLHSVLEVGTGCGYQTAVLSPLVDRLNVGPIPTNQISWDQPHEGNLFEHLYARRSFQASEPLPAETGVAIA